MCAKFGNPKLAQLHLPRKVPWLDPSRPAPANVVVVVVVVVAAAAAARLSSNHRPCRHVAAVFLVVVDESLRNSKVQGADWGQSNFWNLGGGI